MLSACRLLQFQMKQDKPEGYFENDAQKNVLFSFLLATINGKLVNMKKLNS